MNTPVRTAVLDGLPSSALVVDVGGGASPFKRADHVIDG